MDMSRVSLEPASFTLHHEHRWCTRSFGWDAMLRIHLRSIEAVNQGAAGTRASGSYTQHPTSGQTGPVSTSVADEVRIRSEVEQGLHHQHALIRLHRLRA